MRIAIIAVFALAVGACSATPPYAGGTVTKLTTVDQRVGTGVAAQPGMTVTVNYTGWLYDQKAPDKHGRKFDSSLDHGKPFTFRLGAGKVIAGWDEGLKGMKVHGKRELLIPPNMAYGSRGAGSVIPPNASLVFEVTLLNISP